MEDLKKCPFCGGKAEIKHGQDIYDTYIECVVCGCGTKTFNEYQRARDYAVEKMKLWKVSSVCGIISEATKEKAVKAWNRRCCE